MPEPLPPALRGLLEEWDLERETDEVWGRASVAVPVRTGDGGRAVLKVADAGSGPEHEALALQTWGGRGAVRLLRADPHRRAVLVERLERRDLTESGTSTPARWWGTSTGCCTCRHLPGSGC